MRLRAPEPGAATEPDRDPVSVVHAAIDLGVTLLDTAEMYGNEELVGRTIAGRRDEVLLCSKFGVVFGDSGRFDDWSVRADAASVARSCEGSLRRLGTDVIDLYYLHHRSDEIPIEETVTAMAKLAQPGRSERSASPTSPSTTSVAPTPFTPSRLCRSNGRWLPTPPWHSFLPWPSWASPSLRTHRLDTAS